MIDATYGLLRCGGGMKARPLAAGTLSRVHVVVRAAFAQAVRWGWIWDNPVERAHRIVTVAPELRPPTPAELRILLAHVAERDPQLHVLLTLAVFTGARRAQLLGLRWHNVHLAVRRVSFSAGWVEGPNGPVLTATKTKRRHVVDLDPATFDVLVELAASRGCQARPDSFVFSDDDGATAWKPNRVTKAFLRHRRAAGLRQFRLHDLRHFMATEMLHAGVPLGHRLPPPGPPSRLHHARPVRPRRPRQRRPRSRDPLAGHECIGLTPEQAADDRRAIARAVRASHRPRPSRAAQPTPRRGCLQPSRPCRIE